MCSLAWYLLITKITFLWLLSPWSLLKPGDCTAHTGVCAVGYQISVNTGCKFNANYFCFTVSPLFTPNGSVIPGRWQYFKALRPLRRPCKAPSKALRGAYEGPVRSLPRPCEEPEVQHCSANPHVCVCFCSSWLKKCLHTIYFCEITVGLCRALVPPCFAAKVRNLFIRLPKCYC